MAGVLGSALEERLLLSLLLLAHSLQEDRAIESAGKVPICSSTTRLTSFPFLTVSADSGAQVL
jgi:hypothetical protein